MKLGRRLRRQSNVCSSLNCLKQCEEWSGICSFLEVSLETKRSSVADRCGETLLQSERRRGTTQALGELNLERWEKKIKRIFKAQSFLCSRKPALRKQEGTASVIGSGNYAHQCPKYVPISTGSISGRAEHPAPCSSTGSHVWLCPPHPADVQAQHEPYKLETKSKAAAQVLGCAGNGWRRNLKRSQRTWRSEEKRSAILSTTDTE